MRHIFFTILLITIGCRTQSEQSKQIEKDEWGFDKYAIPKEQISLNDDGIRRVKESKEFNNMIASSLKDTVNFAGHCVLISWGCGILCQQSAIIDLKNAKAFAGPSTATGFIYKPGSRLLVVNPKFDKLPDYILRKTELYVWENDSLVHLKTIQW